MLEASVIGDFIVSTDFASKEIPAGVPLKVVGVELDPDPKEIKWKDLPDEIRLSGNPFYIVEFPNIVKQESSIGFVEIKSCKPFSYDENTEKEKKEDFWSNEDFFKYD